MPLDEHGKPLYAFDLQGGPDHGKGWRPNYTWPLPETIVAEGGVYVKIAESELPPEVDSHPNVIRGAQYRWEPTTVGKADA